MQLNLLSRSLEGLYFPRYLVDFVVAMQSDRRYFGQSCYPTNYLLYCDLRLAVLFILHGVSVEESRFSLLNAHRNCPSSATSFATLEDSSNSNTACRPSSGSLTIPPVERKRALTTSMVHEMMVSTTLQMILVCISLPTRMTLNLNLNIPPDDRI
jgi:hypothetical protein